METISLTIQGAPVTKKNSQRILLTKNGRPFIAPSKQYQKYEKVATAQIPTPLRKAISDPVNIRYLFFMPTKRRVDLSNLIEAVDDILVKAGVLEDDNYKIVQSHDGSRVLHDKENPRTEITIETERGE